MVKIKNQTVNKKRKLTKGELYSVQEKIPFKRMDQADIVKEDGSYMAFLKVATHDINGLSAEEQYSGMRQLEKLARIYEEDFSFLSLMFPANVESNLRFWNKKLMQARKLENTARITICREQIQRLIWAELKLSNLEFFLVIYAKGKKEMSLAKNLLKRSGGSFLKLSDVSANQTEKILYKLFNLNTQI